MAYADNIDESIFDYSYYGKTVYRPKERWCNMLRKDSIAFDPSKDMVELEEGLFIGDKVSIVVTTQINSIIQMYWDLFCAGEVFCTIRDYGFSLDTGGAPHICCRKLIYGPHEKPIIMKQVNYLLLNKWIRECGRSWDSMIVLAEKSHQEIIEDVKKIVWRICVSYRGLNKVTKLYEYPIPCCDMDITIFDIGSTGIYFITVDAKKGYHNITVRECDVEKLAFFGSDNNKYGLRIMPFGPFNAPSFYSCMMGGFKAEWYLFFIEELRDITTVKGMLCTHKVSLIDGNVYIDNVKLTSGTKSSIDNVLKWSNNVQVILLYLECVYKIFQKYHVSFRLDKCWFLQNRV